MNTPAALRLRSLLLGLLGLGWLAALSGCPRGSGGTPGVWPYTCAAPRTAGQACVFSTSCAAGLYCAATGTCQPRAASGGACSTTDQCPATEACTVSIDQDGQCHQSICSGGACTIGARTGNSCPIVNGQQVDCPTGETCLLSGAVQPGRCVARPAQGARCEELGGPNPCQAGLVCGRSGLCIDVPTLGQECAIPALCASGLVCIEGANQKATCQAPRTIGQSCQPGHCAKGSHCKLSTLVCTPNRQAGEGCFDGNECGERPGDVGSGLACVNQKCVAASGAGSTCEPELQACSAGLVCDK